LSKSKKRKLVVEKFDASTYRRKYMTVVVHY